MKMRSRIAVLSPAALLVSASAFGQATLYMTAIGNDITPNGNKLVGALYDRDADAYWVHVLDRSTGAHTYYTDRGFEDGGISCNADATVIAAGMYDAENLAGFGTDRSLAHVHAGAGPWVNLGPGPNAFKCDFNINTAAAVASNSNEILINGWTASLCGPFRSWIYNLSTQSFTQLPFSISAPPFNQPSFGTKAVSISNDGTVACGWDSNWNANFTQRIRKSVAWRKVNGTWTESILDPLGGEVTAVSGNGNVIIGYMNTTTMQSTFGTSTRFPVRWVWNGAAWIPQNLGGSGSYSAYFVSDDGNTIVGDFFIWRPSINGGVPMNLASYLSTVGLDTFGMSFGGPAGSATQGLSGDGNSIILQFTDTRNPCLAAFKTGVVDLSGRGCTGPVVLFEPSGQTIVGEIGVPANHYYGVIINVFAAGSGDVAYQWQRENPPGVWVDLADDNCEQFDPHFFDIKGSTGPQLRLGESSFSGAYAGNYRCVITNACGSTTCNVVTITAGSSCPADFNGDGFLDFFDYDDYVTCFETGNCAPGSTADFNGDGFVDFFDYDAFVLAFETGC